MSVTVYVEAENEDEAKDKAYTIVSDDPYEYMRKGVFAGCEVFDTYEEEEEEES